MSDSFGSCRMIGSTTHPRPAVLRMLPVERRSCRLRACGNHYQCVLKYHVTVATTSTRGNRNNAILVHFAALSASRSRLFWSHASNTARCLACVASSRTVLEESFMGSPCQVFPSRCQAVVASKAIYRG